MTNHPGNSNLAKINENQQDFNGKPIDFRLIFENSKDVDSFLKLAIQELPDKPDIQLFIVSEHEIIDQNTTKFELRFNIIYNSNNSDRNNLFLKIIKPAIHHACDSVNSREPDRIEYTPSHSKKNENSWGKKIEKTITNKFFITLFPFIGFILFLTFVMLTGKQNQDDSNVDPSSNPSPRIDKVQ